MIPGEASEVFEFDVSTGERVGTLTNVDLTAFLSGTPIEFLFSTDARTNIFNQVDGGSGRFTNDFSTGSWGRIFVEFDYSPSAVSVSEPAAFSLFGAGLLFLFSNRKKALKR